MIFKIKSLGEICKFQGGSQPPKSNFIYEPKNGYIRFLQIRDFGSENNHTYIPEDKKNKICNSDDIMIGRYGASVGKILRGRGGAYNVALMKATPLNSLVNKEYLWNYFKSSIFQDNLKKVASRSAQDGFSKDDIFDFKVPLPPLPIQQKIVEKLDAIFAEIDKATVSVEANIKNAEALFRSFLHKVFLKIDNYNKPIKLRKIIKLEYGKGLKESERDLNGIYGAYGANGIKSKTNRYLYDKPSIIIGRKGSAGELTIVTEKFWALDVTYYVTHDDSKTDLYFLYYALKILNIPSLSKGIKPGINRNDVYDLSITIPKINDQKLIVKNIFAFSNSLNLVIDLLKKKKIELYSLKQSILKQAFNSELVKAA